MLWSLLTPLSGVHIKCSALITNSNHLQHEPGGSSLYVMGVHTQAMVLSLTLTNVLHLLSSSFMACGHKSQESNVSPDRRRAATVCCSVHGCLL